MLCRQTILTRERGISCGAWSCDHLCAQGVRASCLSIDVGSISQPMKRVALWLHAASRASSAPETVSTGAVRGSPSYATTSRWTHRCHNTAAESPSSITAPPNGTGAASRGGANPQTANGLPSSCSGGCAKDGIPRRNHSSRSSGGGQEGGQTFHSRLAPNNPFLLPGLTGAAFCAGLSLGHMCASRFQSSRMDPTTLPVFFGLQSLYRGGQYRIS